MKVQEFLSSGRTDYRIEGDSREEVEDAVFKVELRFHPLGYGTTFRTPEQRADGSWVVSGYRYNSCD